jgi:arsenite methyltransferase
VWILVVRNCVINFNSIKADTFKGIYRILKPEVVGRRVISDLVTYREVREANSIDVEKWYSYIDRALTKENYIESIRQTGFTNIEISDEKPYLEMEQGDERKITSITIKAII